MRTYFREKEGLSGLILKKIDSTEKEALGLISYITSRHRAHLHMRRKENIQKRALPEAATTSSTAFTNTGETDR